MEFGFDNKLSKGHYDAGDVFIDYYSKSDLDFTGSELTYDIFPDETKTNETQVRLDTKIGYYVIPNLAVGAGIMPDGGSSKEKDTDDKDSWTEWQVKPFVNYYLPAPGCIHHLFVEGAAGFGDSVYKTESGTGSNTNKYGLFEWSAGLGYNWFISPDVSLTPKLYWNETAEKAKDEEPELKYKTSGIRFDMGLRLHF